MIIATSDQGKTTLEKTLPHNLLRPHTRKNQIQPTSNLDISFLTAHIFAGKENEWIVVSGLFVCPRFLPTLLTDSR
jgi:predicted nucleic acid-binding Zn finger protein